MMKKATISIKGSQNSDEYDKEDFELVTDGEFVSENGSSAFSYQESVLTGYNGLQTTFYVEPNRVVMSRGGGIDGDMIFSEKQKHHFLYDTPFGAITMGIDTHSIKKNMHENGGRLEISYLIEVDNIVISRNKFEIDVKTSS